MERWNEITKADKKQKTPGTGERNRIDQEEKEREEKSMEGRGKSRRRSPYRVWKRRGSALLAVLLTLSLMLGDISGLSRVVMAGQGTVREEFRIHREDILKAAEEAIENGEPLSEPLAITSEEEKTEEKYQEILPADGSVYEIFPDIEQVKEVDSLELRIFIRLAEGADPASYTLTGDETLVFLYVNGGDVTAEGRVNIDGYVSEFTKVAAFESEEEPMQPGGTTGAAPGNGAAGSGNGSGNGAAGGSGNAGNGTAAEESESSESDSMDPEDSAADLDGETEAESEEAGDGTSEDGMSPEETLPAETQEPSQEPESSAAEETEQLSGQTPDDETPGDQTDGSEADGTASDENTAEAGTGIVDEDKETAGNTENSDAADDSADNESDVNESDAADDASEGNEGNAEDNGQADPADTENENTEADKEDGAEPEKSDTAENADSNAADEGNEAGSTVTLSLRNIQKVAASLASPSEAETPEADESQEEQEESESDEEDSYYEDNGDPVDEEDAAEAEDEEDIFRKTHDLKGRKYDEAVLDETVTVRAFAAGMEDAGFNRDELLEGAHQLTYTVAEGEARLIYTPEYVRDEAVVTFGIIPAEGMEVYQVTANGEALAETEETAVIASASEAKRAKASSSDADYDEERAVYYQIPQVLEDQTIEIQVVEEGYNDHPAFLQSRTVNGVTVTVSAEEGILPAGTELSVEEVTEQVADAVAEKVESEAGEDSGSDAEELAESEQGEGLSITQVFAYDINLMLDGKKLNNDWGETDVVTVKFSGERIKEASKGAEKIEIATLETPTKTVEAALGGTEEMPVVENLTAEDIQIKTEGRQAIDISGDSSVQEIETDVSHFSIWTIGLYAKAKPKTVTFYAGYENGAKFSDGASYKEVTVSGSYIHESEFPIPPILEENGERAEFVGWVYNDARFTSQTKITGGEKIYALFKTDDDRYKKNQSIPDESTADPGKVTAKKTATWVDYENGLAKIDLSVEGNPKQSGTDVIIILDKSGSMSTRLSGDDYPERMVEARNAARVVRDAFLTEGSKNRVAYIPFSSGEPIVKADSYDPCNHTESYVGFQTYEKNEENHYLELAIRATDAYGGTSYHDALNKAKEVLAARGDDTNEKTVIIFISDGAPNKKYDYVKGETEKSDEDYVYDSNDDPLAVADSLKDTGVEIYSVGIQISNNSNAVAAMRNISSGPNFYYDVEDLGELEDAMKEISGKIQLAGTKAKLEDTLSNHFRLLNNDDFKDEKLNLSQYGLEVEGKGIVTEPGDSFEIIGDKTVSFKVGDITATPQKYQIYVRIKDEYKTPDGEKLYPTNSSVTLTYMDINEKSQTKNEQEIGSPKLDRYGEKIQFQKVLKESENPDFSKVEFKIYRANEKGEFVESSEYLMNNVTFTDTSAGLFTSNISLGVTNDGTAIYYLQETNTASGYNILPEPIKVSLKVDPLGVYVEGTYPDDGDGMLGETKGESLTSTITLNMSMERDTEGKYVSQTKGVYCINNYPGAELPETGGPGFIMMERFGWMLLLIAMLGVEVQMLSNKKKRQ